jgi:uncharacterized protein YdcH (DUF465 family)
MITLEKIIYHIRVLEERHAELDARIDQMELTGQYNDEELSPMKRERLRIKDEITQLTDNINGNP